jgi:hypothetical protein
MTVDELEARLANLQNFLIDNYTITEEIWAYHPANPDFINPIKMYDDLIFNLFNGGNKDLEYDAATNKYTKDKIRNRAKRKSKK